MTQKYGKTQEYADGFAAVILSIRHKLNVTPQNPHKKGTWRHDAWAEGFGDAAGDLADFKNKTGK